MIEKASDVEKQDEEGILISVGGGGAYYTWELGALKAIFEASNGKQITYAAASAGALAATFALCNVDAKEIIRSTDEYNVENGISKRRVGYAFMMESLIRKLMDHFLPTNAGELCTGRLVVLITQWCGFRQGFQVRRVKTFLDKENLIDVVVASCYVPWLFGGTFGKNIKAVINEKEPEAICAVDGTMLTFVPLKTLWGISKASLKITSEEGKKSDYTISPFFDPELKRDVLTGIFTVFGKEKDEELFAKGYQFTKKALASEKYSHLNLKL